MGGDDHRCEWREKAEALETELSGMRASMAEVQGSLAKLQRHVFGKRSEKMPSVAEELRRAGVTAPDPEAALAKRRSNAEKKKALPTREIVHKVPEEKKVCPKCGGHDFSTLGPGKVTTVYEYIPARFERQLHVQEKLRCRCGETILTAEGAPKAYDKAGYGPGLLAHLAVSKCADSIPIYRTAKQYRRHGVPVSRSLLNDLLHRAAEETAPLSKRLLELIAQKEIVQADETTVRVLAEGKTRTAWLWDFIAKEKDQELIGYRYSPSRSGETPVEVLGGTKGYLIVDGYTAYNKVTTPEGRERVGCIAHLRRRFFDALSSAPQARRALDLILEVYKVERVASDQGIVGTAKHLALRQEKSCQAMQDLRDWLEAERSKHLPKGPLGEAIGYALNQWGPLTRFLDDARLPVDNNGSERALRRAALGRRNYLFVGNDKAGQNIAGLYSLVATCEVNGINPFDYLADVLPRLGTHPASRIAELLPHRWTPAQATAPPA
jgi:transposase